MNYNQYDICDSCEVESEFSQVNTTTYNENLCFPQSTQVPFNSPVKKRMVGSASYISPGCFDKDKNRDITLQKRRRAKYQRLNDAEKYLAYPQSAIGGGEYADSDLVEITYEWDELTDSTDVDVGCLEGLECNVQSSFARYFSQESNFSKVANSAECVATKVSEIDVNTLNEFLKRMNDSGLLDSEFTNKVYEGLVTVQDVKEFFDKYKPTSDTVSLQNSIKALCLVLLLYCTYKYYKTGNKNYSIILLSMSALLSLEYGSKFIELGRQLLDDYKGKTVDEPINMVNLEDDVEPQRGSFGICDVGKIFSLILSTYTSCTSGKNVPSELYKNLGSVDRVSNSVESIITYILEAIEVTYNWVLQNFFDRGSYQRFFTHKHSEFQNIINRADELDAMLRAGTFIPNTDNLDRVSVLVYMINDVLRHMPRNQDTANLCQELTSMKVKYMKIMDDNCAAAQIGGNLRPEPVLVMLQGLPGVKKTVLVQQIAADLIYTDATEIEKKEIKANPGTYTFYRRPGEPFWETYTPHHKAVIIDDFGQTTDVAGGETSEFLEVIQMINNAPYPLRMAELADKGKRFFTAKYVLATTNVNDIRPVSIVSSDAVKRRVHFLAQLKPKWEYCEEGSRVFSPSKMPKIMVDGVEETTVNLSMVLFDLVDWQGNILESDLEYSTFKQRILRLKEKHDRYYKVLRQNIQEVMQDSSDVETQGSFRKYDTSSIPKGITHYKQEIHPEDAEATLDYLGRIEASPSRVELRKALNKLSNLSGTHFSHNFDYKVAVLASKYGSLLDVLLDEDGEFNRSNYLQLCTDIIAGRIDPLPMRPTESFLTSSLKVAFEAICTITIDLALGSIKVLRYIGDALLSSSTRTLIMASVLFAPPVAYLIYKGFNGLFKIIFGIDDGYLVEGQSRGKEIPRSKIERNLSKIKTRFNRVEPQLGNDPNGVDMLTSIMNRNCYELYLTDIEDESFKHFGYCIFVRANICLMPYHFVTHLSAMIDDEIVDLKTKITLRRRTKDRPVVYEITVSDIFAGSEPTSLEQNDLVLVQMPRTFQMHRNIVDNFVSDSTVSKMRNTIDISMLCPSFERLTEVQTHAKFVDNKRVNDIDGTQYTVRQSFVYTGVQSKRGDCGSVVAYLNSMIPKEKVLGLHIAGNTQSGIGYCGLVTREMLIDALKHFKFDTVEEEMAEVQSDMYFDSGQFTFINKRDKTPRVPTKTTLTRSKLYGAYDDLFEPNEQPFPINLIRSPEVTKQMFDKYWVKKVNNISYTEEADSVLDWLYGTSHIDMEKRLYTFEEACEGITGSRFMALDRSTSSGYPYNLDVRTSKKSYFFGNGERFDFGRPQALKLREDVFDYINNCAVGHRKPQLYSDFPKDELRSKAKVAALDMRAISGANCVLLIAMRMYFGDFVHWLVSNNVVNGSTIGTDPRSDEWHVLATKLLEKNEYVNAGDYKAYDGSLTPSLLWSVLDLINKWYGDSYSNIRRLMWFEIVFSRHIFDGVVFEWLGSMPSGNPMTAVINTIANHLLMRKAWNMMNIPDDFNQCVYLVVNGDDNIFSVVPLYADTYNEFTIIEYLAEQGMTYTAENKSTNSNYVRRKITEVEYLKRSFVFNPELNKWMGPLRLAKVLEMPYWTRKHDDDITKEKIEDCLTELAYRGKNEFNLYGVRMVEEYRSVFGNSRGWFRTTSYAKIIQRAL